MMEPDGVRAASLAARRATTDERWYLRNRDRLMWRCLRIVGNRQVAEDIVHETFARAIADGLRRNGKSWNWLDTVAHNLCVDHLRRSRRYLRLAAVKGVDVDNEAAAALERVVEMIDSADQREAVVSAFTGLRERERGVLWLRDVEGWDYIDIGDLEGISPRQARNRAFRARDRVRDGVAAALARSLAGILGLREWLRRSNAAASTAQRFAISGVAVTLAFGGLGSFLQRPQVLDGGLDRGRATLALSDLATIPRLPLLVRNVRRPSSDTADAERPAATGPLGVQIDNRHRRQDTLIPERTFLRVEVRDSNGNVFVANETSHECAREGEGFKLTDVVVIGC